MANVTCPKCGYQQEGGEECQSCGIIFNRYVPGPEPKSSVLSPQAAPEPEEETVPPGLVWRFYRVFRWVVLVVALLVIYLILKPGAPPEIDDDPKAGRQVAAKMQRLQLSAQTGRSYTLQLNEAELNSWLQSNLAIGPQPGETDRVRRAAADKVTGGAISKIAPPKPREEPTLREVQSSVKDVKIGLAGDRVQAYLLFDLYGKEMSLMLEGRLSAENGYLRLEPTAGRLGSFPIPSVSLDNAASRLFDSPENREKFRLPPEIRDIYVENGVLRVLYR